MKYGSVAGLEKPVSRLVQGTLSLNPAEREAGFALLDAVLEMGCTCFDTAHVYGGEREKAFGQWIRDRRVREKVVILAKGAHHNDVRPRVTPFDIASDLHDSLARMQVDYCDLYVLHRDDPRVPVGPIVEALNHWQREGKIRAFGGSNWSHTRLQEANDYAAAHGLNGFTLSSPHFSLAEQLKPPWPGCLSITGHTNSAAQEWYSRAQMPLFAWSSLGGGFFSGLITPDNLNEIKDNQHKLSAECYASDANFERLARVTELAKRKGCTSALIAMAWLMRQPMNIFALVGCRSAEEFKQNVEALEIELTDEETAWVDLRG